MEIVQNDEYKYDSGNSDGKEINNDELEDEQLMEIETHETNPTNCQVDNQNYEAEEDNNKNKNE